MNTYAASAKVRFDDLADGGLASCVICGRMGGALVLVGDQLAYACVSHVAEVELLLG